MGRSIVDGHMHLIPAIAGIAPGGPVTDLGFGTVQLPSGQVIQIAPGYCRDARFPVEQVLRTMDAHGVKRSILIQGNIYGLFNVEVTAAAAAHPDRLTACMLVDPYAPGADDEVDRLAGLHGVRVLKFECSETTGMCGIHPEFEFMSRELAKIWERSDRHGLTVVVDPGPIEGRGYQVEALDTITTEHTQTHFVVTHLGCPFPGFQDDLRLLDRWQAMTGLAHKNNVWIDVSAMPYFFHSEEYPYPTARELMRRVADEVGADRLIWGSDAPGNLIYATYHQMIAFIETSDQFTVYEKNLMFEENARAAFRLD